MKRNAIRVGLSLLVAVGWWVQKLPAQTPPAPLPPVVNQPACPPDPLAALPPVVNQAASPAVALTPIDSSTPTFRQRLKQVANKYGRCCSSDMNNPGCMGPRAELQFIFGSCRYWFGEPCLPPAPPRR
jgi:hypothetical protein